MSKTNQKKQQQQLFDVDEDVPLDSSNYGTESNVNHAEKKIPATTNESASTATTSYSATPTSSATATTSSSSNSSGTNTMSLRAFALPDGRIMDAKNTLQSFDHVPMSAQRVTVATAAVTKHPVVRNGNETTHPPFTSKFSKVALSSDEVIESATLYKPSGSFGRQTVASVNVPISSKSSGTIRSDPANALNLVAPMSILNTCNDVNSHSGRNDINRHDEVIHAHAVAVHSVIVAEGDVLDSHYPQAYQHPNSIFKKGKIFWLVIAAVVILVGIVGVVGGYCGSGKCGSKEREALRSSSGVIAASPGMQRTSIPTKSPTTPQNSSTVPTISITDMPMNLPASESTGNPTKAPTTRPTRLLLSPLTTATPTGDPISLTSESVEPSSQFCVLFREECIGEEIAFCPPLCPDSDRCSLLSLACRNGS